jgi:Arc/MetJ-type ribon-helix-helix transcriptional regulator
MKPLTVRLPDSLVAEIERESRARRLSKSDVVRERLRQPHRALENPSAVRDLIGDILDRSWKAEVPVHPRGFASPKKQKLAEMIRAQNLHRR